MSLTEFVVKRGHGDFAVRIVPRPGSHWSDVYVTAPDGRVARTIVDETTRAQYEREPGMLEVNGLIQILNEQAAAMLKEDPEVTPVTGAEVLRIVRN